MRSFPEIDTMKDEEQPSSHTLDNLIKKYGWLMIVVGLFIFLGCCVVSIINYFSCGVWDATWRYFFAVWWLIPTEIAAMLLIMLGLGPNKKKKPS